MHGPRIAVGMIEYRLGRKEESAAAFRIARDGYASLVVEFPAVPAYRQNLAWSHNGLGGSCSPVSASVRQRRSSTARRW